MKFTLETKEGVRYTWSAKRFAHNVGNLIAYILVILLFVWLVYSTIDAAAMLHTSDYSQFNIYTVFHNIFR